MQLSLSTSGRETIFAFRGVVDGELPADVDAQVRARIEPGCLATLDLDEVDRVTPAGLRWIRLLYRQVHGEGGRARVVGLNARWVDILDAVGVLHLSVPIANDQLDGVDADRPLSEQRVDLVPSHHHAGYALRIGHVFPFGAWPVDGGINFSIYSRHATACTLVLFRRGEKHPMVEIPFPPEFRIGDVFTMLVLDLRPEGLEYGYRFEGPFDARVGHRFDASKIVLGPFARAISGQDVWGRPRDPDNPYPFRAFIPADDFEWEGDRPLELPVQDLVIYEMHVRGFTRHPSSGVRFPGTYAAIREKIPYLKQLGVNALELLPIFEFDERENSRPHPRNPGETLGNYWGYSTLGFYAPKSALAATGPIGMQVDELKALVKELHRNGIEIILDVVFNHTAEGNEHGPTLSFRGIDNRTYYMLTPDGHYYNFSGCGNTFNCNNPSVRDFILNCLRYWVAEYHIDGFRFDLASILGRAPDGTPLANPPLLESLALDPVLGRTKLIAEAWDAGGLYQVGSFPDYGRWAEWNGKFRDCIRRFLKGDTGCVGEIAQRLVGSPDLYSDTGPTASVNFITAHDGFTLADLVSYNHKHNEDNGEQNRDGANDNYSWNHGAEGPTDDPAILTLRRRQMKNAFGLLFLSQGVPMLQMGDEIARTQNGNNNTYCHDNALNWLDWTLTESNADLLRFCGGLIALRLAHPALRFPQHAGRPAADGSFLEVTWHGIRPWHADWSEGSRSIALMLRRYGGELETDDVLYLAFNMFWGDLTFRLPAPPPGLRWHVAANSAMPTPEDVWELGSEPQLANASSFHAAPRSFFVLTAKPDLTGQGTLDRAAPRTIGGDEPVGVTVV